MFDLVNDELQNEKLTRHPKVDISRDLAYRYKLAACAFALSATVAINVSAQQIVNDPSDTSDETTLLVTITGSIAAAQQHVSNIQHNSGDIDGLLDEGATTTLLISGGELDGTTLDVNNQRYTATGAGNYQINLIDFADGVSVANEGLIGNLQYNSGEIATDVNAQIGINLDDGGGDADVTDSQLRVNNAVVSAKSTANDVENLLTGDFSATSGDAVTLSFDNTAGVRTVDANFAVSNVQINDNNGKGVAATVSDVDIGIATVASTTTNGDPLEFEISNHQVSALVRANAASNIIQGTNGSLANTFAIQSAQDTNSKISATVEDINIHYDGAELDDTNLTIANNEVSADGFGNTVNNVIQIENGGADSSYGIENEQVNSGAIDAEADTVTITAALSDDSGNVGADLSSNSISANAMANYAHNFVEYTNGGQGFINNRQGNTGDVTATIKSSGVAYTGGTSDITDSTISLSNNSVSAAAYGNYAVNIVRIKR